MSIPRRLGRLARGFVTNLNEDERFRDTLRDARDRSETLRRAFEAARKGVAEEWRRGEERRATEEQQNETTDEPGNFGERVRGWRSSTDTFVPRRYPPNVLAAYEKLGLMPGAPMDEVDRKRRDLVKRFHPDRFSDPEKRARAEKVTAEINAAHDAIERHARARAAGS